MIGLVLFGWTAALAQQAPTVDAQNYRPTLDGRALLWTDDAAVGAGAGVGFSLGYARNPLKYEIVETGETGSAVGDLLQLDLLGTYSWRFLRAGLDLPIVPASTGDLSLGGGGLGDVAFELKAMALDPEARPLGLAAGLRVTAPTTTGSVPVGAQGAGVGGQLIASHVSGPVTLAMNLGYDSLPSTSLDSYTMDDQITARLGTGLGVSDALAFSIEVVGKTTPSAALLDPSNSPLEMLIGAHTRLSDDLVLRLGGGAGLTSGIGAPAARLVAQLSWSRSAEGDADLDGLLDSVDRCPDQPEDADGFEDADGCPEAGTPVQIVMRDPYTGLVEGITVTVRDELGAESTGGASFLTSLEPGSYALEAQAEGYHPLDDAFTVEMGVPVQVVKVLSPIVEPARITVTDERIKIAEKIYFETGSDRIRPESFDLLDAIAQTLAAHPELQKVRIEGHTDNRGDADYNLALSQRRAAAVLIELVQRGVSADRLASGGKGEGEPIDPRDEEPAWEVNRRVEFLIEGRTP